MTLNKGGLWIYGTGGNPAGTRNLHATEIMVTSSETLDGSSLKLRKG